MVSFIKRIGATLSGSDGSITNGKTYAVIAWDGFTPGPTGSSGNGNALALIVDDDGNLFVTTSVPDQNFTDWQFVSASYCADTAA